MKNKSYYFFLIFILGYFINISAHTTEIFNFDVTELEIVEEGNKFIGKKGGTATSEDGSTITAEKFFYNKLTNILEISGNVKYLDSIKNIVITADKAIYQKNKG